MGRRRDSNPAREAYFVQYIWLKGNWLEIKEIIRQLGDVLPTHLSTCSVSLGLHALRQDWKKLGKQI